MYTAAKCQECLGEIKIEIKINKIKIGKHDFLQVIIPAILELDDFSSDESSDEENEDLIFFISDEIIKSIFPVTNDSEYYYYYDGENDIHIFLIPFDLLKEKNNLEE